MLRESILGKKIEYSFLGTPINRGCNGFSSV